MRRTVGVFVVLLALAQGATAQCLGDFDNDGIVRVNELVTAVNNALQGCAPPSPTPTRAPGTCPFAFTDDTGDEACEMTIHFARSVGFTSVCATFPAGRWRGDGQVMLIEVDSAPRLTIIATVTGENRATVTGYQIGLDPQVYPVSATINRRDYEQDGIVDGFHLVGAQTWFNVNGCSAWVSIYGFY